VAHRCLWIACIAAAATGCSAKTNAPAHLRDASRTTAEMTPVERELRSVYAEWRGTRHRMGGQSKSGTDCSGFVQLVFRDKFGVSLPRTTKQQVSAGHAVGASDLRAGDLVFFRPPTYPRHVGIYLGGGEFVHASTHKGVIISHVSERYWNEAYWTARRVLQYSGG